MIMIIMIMSGGQKPSFVSVAFVRIKKIVLFLGQKYDHPRLQYFKLKLESSGNDSILRAEASFS